MNNNLATITASRKPTMIDDIRNKILIGQSWVNINTPNLMYVCIDNTYGMAKWTEIQGSETYDNLFFDNFSEGVFKDWNIVNDNANKWIVGSQESYTKGYSAYISNNNTDAQYDIGTSQVSHIYNTIVLPYDVSDVIVSFYLKIEGERNYDYFDMSVTPDEIIPIVSQRISNDYRIAEGLTDIHAWTYHKYSVIDILKSLDAGTEFHVVGSWINDGSVGAFPGACVDLFNVECRAR